MTLNTANPASATSFPVFDPSRPVAIIGLGAMGAKVAWSCARSGIPTRGFDVDPEAGRTALRLARTWGTAQERSQVEANLRAVESLEEALRDAQLVFENVPERAELKKAVHAQIAAQTATGIYIGTNTSSLLSGPLARASGRPEHFFAMNFTDPRDMRLVELMAPTAAPATLDFARRWAAHLGMVPITVRQDQMGYSFNRLWRTIKKEVLRQIGIGATTPEDIDRAWMLAFGMPFGPCGLMDEIGLESVLSIELQYAAASGNADDQPPQFLRDMVAMGHLGVRTGKGFYTYPDPTFRRQDFLDTGG